MIGIDERGISISDFVLLGQKKAIQLVGARSALPVASVFIAESSLGVQ